MPLASCQICSPLSAPDWDAKVAALPGATFFHSAAWARVLKESYGFAPVYFAQGDGERLQTLLPIFEVDSWLTGRRGVSLPFTDSCAPLCPDQESFERLVSAATAFGRSRRWRYLELRGGRSLLDAETIQSAVGRDLGRRRFALLPPTAPSKLGPYAHRWQRFCGRSTDQLNGSDSSVPVFAWYYGHVLDLQKDEAALSAGFDSSVRRAVRKAEKSELKIEFSRSLDAVRDFFGLLCITRKRQGAPPQPFRFFETIWRHVIAENKGWVVLARQGATPVAGAVYFHWGQTALYKFGASDERYQELRPNNLVMARAIEWHRANGFTALDFGRTAPYAEGLRRFKQSWGAAEQKTEYLKFNFRMNRFVAGSNDSEPRSTAVMKRLPVPALRLIGQILYRHVG